jgi:hypothetical protein
MTHRLRKRFWLELALLAVSLGALVLTVVWRTWIERLFGIDPDQGSGALEWAITCAVLVNTVFMGSLARGELRRAATVAR